MSSAKMSVLRLLASMESLLLPACPSHKMILLICFMVDVVGRDTAVMSCFVHSAEMRQSGWSSLSAVEECHFIRLPNE